MSKISEQSSLQVLIVDDQKNWRETLAGIVRDRFIVKTAASREDAKAVILNERPPVVVTDIRLNDNDQANEDGLKLLAQIAELGEITNVIVITGYSTTARVRKALKGYAAFDYVEKYPTDGTRFDQGLFRQIVQNALEDAARRRPSSFAERDAKIIIVENDPVWRHKVGAILEQKGFVVEIATARTAEAKLKAHPFNLIITDAKLLNGEPDLLFEIEQSNPQARIIVAVAETDEWAEVISKPSIAGMLRKDENLKSEDLLWTITRALGPKATKWIVAELAGVQVKDLLKVQQSCILTLTMQDQKPSLAGRDVVSVWLPPEEKMVTLTVSIYARDMEVIPGQTRIWDIPARESPIPLEFKLIPRDAGRKRILIDLSYAATRWLQRLEKEVQVES